MGALIPAVDPGTGAVNLTADSYVTDAELDDWLGNNPSSVATADALQEAADELGITVQDLKRGAARQAALFMDSKWCAFFSGSITDPEQRRMLPRTDLVDQQGRMRTGVPWEAKECQCILVLAALEESLYSSREEGVLEESLGPITTRTVESGARRCHEVVEATLGQLMINGGFLRLRRI